MPNYHQPLIPGETYHLFSRAIGNECIFKIADNYRYFLLKFKQHIFPIAECYTYSLLPGHFHLFVRIRQSEQIGRLYEDVKQKTYYPHKTDLADFTMEQFSNWLNGYTKAFNKMFDRKGALFMDYLKRNHAANAQDFPCFLYNIHKNAVHHGLCNGIGTWPYDGYRSLLSYAPTSLLREEVLAWFGSREAFVRFHERPELHEIDFPDY